MTVKELSQLYWLNREIEADERRLAELESRVRSLSSPKLDGMPRNSGANVSKIEVYVAEIVDVQAIIASKRQQCIHEQNRLERYIAGIPDSITRQIFALRFINGLTWTQTALSLGGGNTDVSVRQRVYRYLRDSKEETAQ